MKNKKGIAIIVTYSILVLLLMLSAAFMYQGINANYLTKKKLTNNTARANAEKGIAYVLRELSFNSDLITHTVNASTDVLESADLTATLKLPNTAILNDAQLDIDGCYFGYGSSVSDVLFRVKTYHKPGSEGDTVVVSQGIDAGHTVYLASTISSTSLYDYFMFFQGNQSFGWGSNFDGKGLGRIFVNGNAYFTQGKITDAAEFAVAKDIKIPASTYNTPARLDSIDGTTDNKAPLPTLYVDMDCDSIASDPALKQVAFDNIHYNDASDWPPPYMTMTTEARKAIYNEIHDFNGDGNVNKLDYVYIPDKTDETKSLPWKADGYVYNEWLPAGSYIRDWKDVDNHFYIPSNFYKQFIFTAEGSGTTADYSFNLPSTGSTPAFATSWDWQMYNTSEPYPLTWQAYDYETGAVVDVANNFSDEGYWKNILRALEDTGNLSDIDKADIENYAWAYGSNTTVSVNYLDTAVQSLEWNGWLESTTMALDSGDTLKLSDVVKTNEGIINPPEVAEYYATLAQDPTVGIYIDPDEIIAGSSADPKVQALIDESCITMTQFYNNYNPVVDTTTTKDPDTTNDITFPEPAVKVDVACVKALSDSGESFKANVIYVKPAIKSVAGQLVDNSPSGTNKDIPISSLLVNGESIPDGGMTFVAPYPVYVKSDFNISDPQPASIITNSNYYVLSDQYQDYGTERRTSLNKPATTCTGEFTDPSCDGPQHLPGLRYSTDGYSNPLEYPYETPEHTIFAGKNNPPVAAENKMGDITQRVSVVIPGGLYTSIENGYGSTVSIIGSRIEVDSWTSESSRLGYYDRSRVSPGGVSTYYGASVVRDYDEMLLTSKPPGDFSGTASELMVEVTADDFLKNTKF